VEAARSLLQQRRMLQLPDWLAPAPERAADVAAAAAAAGVRPQDLAAVVAAAAAAAEPRVGGRGPASLPPVVPAGVSQEAYDAAVLRARAAGGGHVTRGLAASGALGAASLEERELVGQVRAAGVAWPGLAGKRARCRCSLQAAAGAPGGREPAAAGAAAAAAAADARRRLHAGGCSAAGQARWH
jgi:hypothetical protein